VLKAGRFGAPIVLALSFAVFVQLCIVLAGRFPAAPLTAALALGALATALLATPAPFRRARSLGRTQAVMAAVAGLLMLGAPALVVGLRMSDAPAGSIVVFLMSGGWAAAAALAGAAFALLARRRLEASWGLSGALLVLAGAAGVVACWERPSSFSPFVRFATQSSGILFGGILLVVGGLLLVRAARSSDTGGALIIATAAAAAAALAWWGVSGFGSGWGRLAEQSLTVCAAAIAWGLVSASLLEVLRHQGPPVAAACLAVTPVLLPLLSLVEQAVGVAGPQPLVIPGVIAGSLVIAAGCAALLHAPRARAVVGTRLLPTAAAVVVALSVVGLALPAIAVSVSAAVSGGRFSGAWSMSGAESVLGWCVLALSVLVMVSTFDTRPGVPAVAALLACAGLPWLAEVPTHIWTATLAPEIQQYYGTEYATITFTAIRDIPLVAAVGLGIVVLLVIIVARRGPAMRSAQAATNDGGRRTP